MCYIVKGHHAVLLIEPEKLMRNTKDDWIAHKVLWQCAIMEKYKYMELLPFFSLSLFYEWHPAFK